MAAIVVEVTGRMVLLIPAAVRKVRGKGRQEERQEWLAWYQRQQAAFRGGQSFNEPPPAGPNAKNGK